MTFPSFEETNSPGYDEALHNTEQKKSFLGIFKSISKNKISVNKDKSLDSYISTSQFHLVFAALNNGAALTSKQDKMFTEALVSEVYNNFGLFEHTLTYGKQDTIPDRYLIKAIFHASHNFNYSIYNYIALEQCLTVCKFPLTKSLYQERFQDDNFKRQIFDYWSESLNNVINHKINYCANENTKNFYILPHEFYEKVIENPVMMLKEILFEKATREEYLNSLIALRKYPKDFQGISNKLVAYVKQESPWLKARNLPYTIEKNNFFNNSIKSLQQNSIIDISLGKKDDTLPKESKIILNNIQTIFTQLNKDYNLLTPEDQFIIKNIYENRLPELIKNFEDIKKEYRDNMNSITDKNANELLIESLKSIEDMTLIVLDNLNEKKILNLSTTQKYISAIKNKMR